MQPLPAECAQCLERLVEVSQFLQSISEENRTGTDEALTPDFEALWQRLHPQTSSASGAPSHRAGFWAHPRALLPLAASLLVALALTLIWALSLRQENKQLAEVRSGADRLRNLEQENRGLQQQSRHLQDQISANQQRYESELAQLKLPEVNVPVRNIYPRDDRQRSAGQGEVNRISVPRGTRTLILILSVYDQGYKDYGIEIVDQAGRAVWRAEALRPGEAGDLSLKLDRTLLGQKRLVVRLFGRRDGRSLKVAEYVVLVE